jgi:hypothetical protein
VAKHATVACAPLDLDEAIVSPPVAPAVLHQPVVQAGLTAVTDNGDGVIVLVTEIPEIWSKYYLKNVQLNNNL